MKGFELLGDDHDCASDLFVEITRVDADQPEQRAELFGQIDAILRPHAAAEHDLVYPAIAGAANDNADARELVLEVREGDRLIALLLDEVRALDPAHETFGAKLRVVEALFERHVKEVEHALFGYARNVLDNERLAQLNDAISERRPSSVLP